MRTPYHHRKPRHKEQQEYQGKRILLQRRLKHAMLILVILLLILFFVGGDMGLWTMWHSIRYERKLAGIVAKEEKRTRELDETIRRLDCDTLFIEQIARINLGMIRDNEKIFLFPTEFGKE